MDRLYAILFQWVQHYGLHGAFLLMVAESAGAPVPTELGFLTAQGLIVAHTASWWAAMAWIVAGHLVGSAIGFYVGRAADSALARRLARRPSVMHARAQLHGWFERYGSLTILFGRLVGQVRPWVSFVAGLSRVPPATFWLWTVIGTLIFTPIAMWITAVGLQFWLTHAVWRAPLIIAMLLIFYGLPLYKLIEHLIKRHHRRKTHLTSE
ncbi:MAG: VTT domain-containing protein [Armatimonadia bacterium]